jgi:hypothetical protein
VKLTGAVIVAFGVSMLVLRWLFPDTTPELNPIVPLGVIVAGVVLFFRKTQPGPMTPRQKAMMYAIVAGVFVVQGVGALLGMWHVRWIPAEFAFGVMFAGVAIYQYRRHAADTLPAS